MRTARRVLDGHSSILAEKGVQIIVNGKPIDTYFPGAIWTAQVQEPFQTVSQQGRFNVDVKVVGGGHSGQAGAIRHAVARALLAAGHQVQITVEKQVADETDRQPRERSQDRFESFAVHELAAVC